MTDQQETVETSREPVNKNSLGLGFALGGIAPLLALVIYFYTQIYPNGWGDFFTLLAREKRLLSSLTVICLLPNIALFTIFVNTRRDQTSKGIFAITLLFAISSLIVKFLG